MTEPEFELNEKGEISKITITSTGSVKGVVKQQGATKMKPLPDKQLLRIMWQVAVTSAIEGQGETHEIYARQLYHYLAGTYDHLVLKDKRDDDETED